MQYRKCGIQLNRWSTSLTVLEQQILSLCYCPYCHYSLNLSSSLFFLFPLCMCVCFAFNSMLSGSWHSDRSTRCWRWSLFPQISHHRNTLGQIKKVCVSVNLPVCSVYLSLCLCKCLIICPFRLSVCMYPFFAVSVCLKALLLYLFSHKTYSIPGFSYLGQAEGFWTYCRSDLPSNLFTHDVTFLDVLGGFSAHQHRQYC